MNYKKIVKRYEKCFETHGDSHLGVEWKTKESAEKRYEVMAQLIKDKGRILDFGCGTAAFLKYCERMCCEYTGLDISEKYISFCKEKYKENRFINIDVLKDSFTEIFDYVIMNGIFTCKDVLTYDEMQDYFLSLTRQVFNNNTNKGLAFNVMSPYVDYEKEYLFHVPLNNMAKFVTTLTKNFVIRHDYGLYEYTVYLYK
jgi:cyclopropane fatty-acyl-phospholipid synthase-like methyltransferase